MVTRIDEVKANKQELLDANASIDGLNQRIKHLSVIQTEFATLLEPIRMSIHQFDPVMKQQLHTKISNIQQ